MRGRCQARVMNVLCVRWDQEGDGGAGELVVEVDGSSLVEQMRVVESSLAQAAGDAPSVAGGYAGLVAPPRDLEAHFPR